MMHPAARTHPAEAADRILDHQGLHTLAGLRSQCSGAETHIGRPPQTVDSDGQKQGGGSCKDHNHPAGLGMVHSVEKDTDAAGLGLYRRRSCGPGRVPGMKGLAGRRQGCRGLTRRIAQQVRQNRREFADLQGGCYKVRVIDRNRPARIDSREHQVAQVQMDYVVRNRLESLGSVDCIGMWRGCSDCYGQNLNDHCILVHG